MAPVVPHAAWLLLTAMALAGCSEPPEATAPPRQEPPVDDAGRDLLWHDDEAIGVALTDCLEWGGTYPATSTGWDLPPGFAAMETGDGMTFILEVWYICQSGAVEVTEHLIMLPVVPPPDLADASARFQVMLLAGHSDGAADLYQAWGFGDVLGPGQTAMAASPVPTWDASWQATSASWQASVEADFDFTRTPGEAAFARIYHPVHPERIVHVSWSAYENRDDGGTSLLDARGIPAIAAVVEPAILQGVPFARSGSAYDWSIERV